jgi:two-component system response regulator AlgR
VKRERLAAALQRAARRLPAPDGGTAPAQDSVLVVSERGRVARIPLADVLYLKAELKYVTLRTPSRHWVLDDALTELEQRLGERFLRIHRNALVSMRAVRALNATPSRRAARLGRASTRRAAVGVAPPAHGGARSIGGARRRALTPATPGPRPTAGGLTRYCAVPRRCR